MLDLQIPILTLAAATAVMALACTLQASVGIGMALLAAPLLLLLDSRLVPGPMLLAGTVLAASSAFTERRSVSRQALALPLLGLLLGTGLGGIAQLHVRPVQLNFVFATTVLCAVLLSLAGFRVSANPIALFIGGTVSGAMGTLVGIHGPPMAIVLQGESPVRARATLGVFFSLAYLGTVAALVVFGRFGRTHLLLSAALIPGVLTGLAVAPYLRKRLSPEFFRRAVLLVSAASASALFFK